ncbi:MAG TPA: hypothetical protein VHB49_01600 [Bradyrhizobium sp.]|nr:hypothetical protein [Bradyrhizobium sp.]
MISTRRYSWARLSVLAAGFCLASVISAGAQSAKSITSILSAGAASAPSAPSADDTSKSDPPGSVPPRYDPWASTRPAETTDDVAATADAPAETSHDDAKDIDADKLDWSELDVDASTLAAHHAGKLQSASKAPSNGGPSWSSNSNSNGSSAVSVKESLAGFLDPQVGADMTVAQQPQLLTESQILAEKLANGGSLPESSGSAWASVSAPGVDAIWDKTAVQARVDPGLDQSRLGTSLSKSVPLSSQYSLTLENGYDVVEQGIGAPGRPTHSYDTEQTAKLNINDTGTSLTAGQTFSSTDDRWLHSVGAEQKLFGGVSINGSISETSAGPENKSITAGYKQSW